MGKKKQYGSQTRLVQKGRLNNKKIRRLNSAPIDPGQAKDGQPSYHGHAAWLDVAQHSVTILAEVRSETPTTARLQFVLPGQLLAYSRDFSRRLASPRLRFLHGNIYLLQ
ncbi:uncharacterized protein LOC117172985 [Belonocnema kinseyi]|uniref:uncharacterized protein LOC117172985 n=1 Tax=Belonocnema kinseyi TaxID=2817044 RepID=UPI00143D2C5E|nr:uncharacterized protein LOC117172985 [Belonocnema kinseyi]